MMTGYFRMLIDGQLVDGDHTMDIVNPATEQTLAQCPRASSAQLEEAVDAARRAFPGWAATPIETRREKLFALADAIEADADALARLLTSEQGKPLSESGAEIAYTVAFIRSLSALDLESRLIEEDENRRVEMHRKPLGVVALIVPWNFPVLTVAFKLPLALLAGNTAIVKPAPTTPLTTLRLGALCAALFPPGVVNIIADANDLGGQLSAHPAVAKISFTGSTETGRKVMASAAPTIKRLTLELGGNDAGIVLDDADPRVAAQGIFSSAFMNAGQVCIALKRVYAHETIYDDLCDELASLAKAAIVDDGLAQGAQIGPVQNRAQFEKVKGFLEDACANGTVIAGGAVCDRPGYFIQPTIVRDIEDGSRIVDEEQFGPILPVIRYSDVEDALRSANASPYGLGGSVWGKDVERASRIASRLEVGTAWVNKHLDFGPTIPFGGAKQSGLGVEFAEEGLAEYTRIQVLNIAKEPA